MGGRRSSLGDDDDCGDGGDQGLAAAPFLTGLPYERHSVRLASLGSSFELPPGLYTGRLAPPPAANMALAAAAATDSLFFADARQRRAWERAFHGDAMQAVLADAFWWTLARFFCVERDDDLLPVIEARLAPRVAAVLAQAAGPLRDLVADNLPDALAQVVVYMVYAAHAGVRARLDAPMCAAIAMEFGAWFHGPVHQPIDLRHWRLIKAPPAPEPKPPVDSVQECLAAIDNEGLRPSEKLDVVNRNRKQYVRSVIPIRTIQSVETFANSKLVTQFAGKARVRPLRVRWTQAGAPRQPRAEAMFMRMLGLCREHDSNQKLRTRLDEIRAQLAKDVADADKERRQLRRSFRAARNEARGTSSEFVAGVVRQIQEDAGQGLGVSRLRTLSDAVRNEFRLGPAPSKDLW